MDELSYYQMKVSQVLQNQWKHFPFHHQAQMKDLNLQVMTCVIKKVLPHWRMLFPWAKYEEGKTEIVYCCDCRIKAGLKNEFARGKGHPLREWKKEYLLYLRRHADSRDHTTHAPWLLVQQRQQLPWFKSLCFRKRYSRING